MAFSLFTTLFAHGQGAIRRGRNQLGYDIGEELNEGFFHLVGGQPRCSIVHDALTYRIRGVTLSEYNRLVQHYLRRINSDSRLANYPEVVLYEQNPTREFLNELYEQARAAEIETIYREFFANIRVTEDTLDTECSEHFIPSWQKQMGALLQESIAQLTKQELVARFVMVANLLREEACTIFVKAARLGFFAFTRLRRLLEGLFPEEGEAFLNILTAGIPPERNPNLRFNIALSQLGHGRDLSHVLEEFGHLAMHELEIMIPRHAENPSLVRQMANQMSHDPGAVLRENEIRSQELLQELQANAGTKGALLQQEVDQARRYLSLREVVKFEYLKGYALLRRYLVALETGLSWEKDLIFFLTVEEVHQLGGDENALRARAEDRRREQLMTKTLYVPSVVDSQDLSSIGNAPNGDSRFLQGIGVTNAVIEGEAVVMHSFDNAELLTQLKPGSILVTVTTDPAWSPVLALLGKKGGLVTEVGGLLAHGAIYAREMGFAAVLNVPQATTRLKTGMRVRVHGPGSYVEILD